MHLWELYNGNRNRKNLCKILKCRENGTKLVQTFISGQGSDIDGRDRNKRKKLDQSLLYAI